MQHLKPSDVEYSRRPITVNEFRVQRITQLLDERHPDFYQAWCNLLMLRCEQAYPLETFANILMRDFPEHMSKCLQAMNETSEVDVTLAKISAQWQYDFRERTVRNDPRSFRLDMQEM